MYFGIFVHIIDLISIYWHIGSETLKWIYIIYNRKKQTLLSCSFAIFVYIHRHWAVKHHLRLYTTNVAICQIWKKKYKITTKTKTSKKQQMKTKNNNQKKNKISNNTDDILIVYEHDEYDTIIASFLKYVSINVFCILL